MRRVRIFKWVRKADQTGCEKVPVGEGTFVQYGVGMSEFDTGAATYSTAIIEMADGTVQNVPVENIQFIPDDTASQS